MIEGLPLEFKLLRKGEFVGYGKFAIDIVYPVFGLRWYTSTDDKGWHCGNCSLYDEMRQFTGFKDKNDNKIYFGDKLSYEENKINTEPFVVMIDNGDICGKSKRAKIYPFSFQKYTELTDDTP